MGLVILRDPRLGHNMMKAEGVTAQGGTGQEMH